MTACCPCCGAPLPPDRMVMDLQTNTLVQGSRRVTGIVPKVAEFMYVLLDRWPKTASYDDLKWAIWGAHGEPPSHCLQVYASKSRKVFREFGASVEFIEGRGYRLMRNNVKG